MNAIYLRS